MSRAAAELRTDMMTMKNLMGVLMLTCLLPTGVKCKKNSVFVYSRLGGDALLPCTDLVSSDCSVISWTFFKGGRVRFSEEVSAGKVSTDSDKSSRMSITSNCSVTLRGLRVDDAGSYVCRERGDAITDVYLSLITITSPTGITDLQPGGNLTLNCILFTYYDAGSCKPYSSGFNLSWAAEDGSTLPEASRYELTGRTRCHITLVTKLQRDDNNRKWRCQASTKENHAAVFLDFTSAFLFEDASSSARPPAASVDCPVHLPVSRIVLCLALPAMVIIVGVCTKRRERRGAKASAAAIEFQEINC